VTRRAEESSLDRLPRRAAHESTTSPRRRLA
jgi:hypothetical protein